jgi:RHS repeat-associated protein
MTGQTAVNEYVPPPGGAAAVFQGTTLAYHRHVDWQGSAGLATTPSRTLYSATQYAAFGQPFDSTAGPDLSFTGQPQFYGGDQYNFPMRNLSPIQGRWWTPDPAGLAAVDPSNPQSWNAYAYVNGDPLEETDPTGMWCIFGIWGNTCDSGEPTNQDGDPWGPPTDDQPVPPGHPPIRVGVKRPGRQLEQSTTAPNNGPQQQNACTRQILNAVGNQFGPGTYDVTNTFPQGGGADLQITATNLSASQFDAFQTGRYPLNWWTYVIGYGPTLHVTGATFSDPHAYFSNSNIGGVTSVDFTAHIDTAFAYNPIGFLIHFFRDMLHLGGPRNPCP